LKDRGFDITLLTRNLDKTKAGFPGLPVVTVDYDSTKGVTDSLKQLDKKQDALIILINRDEAQAQINLIDAAIATEIPHIIPSAFGFTTTHPEVRRYPVLWPKAKMEDYLIQKAEEGKVTYTQVQPCAFFDWALDRGVYLNTKDDAPTAVFDGGDIPVSVTILDDIGKAVAVSLQKIDQVKNRDVHIHTAVITQNQILGYAKQAAPQREFKVINLDSAELEKQAWEKYDSGDTSPLSMRPFIIRIVFGKKLGLFQTTDNELLGIEQWSDDRVKEFIAGYFK
jgi:hypothetical protein